MSVDLKMVNFLLCPEYGYTKTHVSFVFGTVEPKLDPRFKRKITK